MRCIDRFNRLLAVILAAFLGVLSLSGCGQEEEVTAAYETENYNRDIYRGGLFAEQLCVSSGDVALAGAPDTSVMRASALFDVEHQKVDFAHHMFDQVYPASTTKTMTALLAIKNGDLSSIVTVSANADSRNFAADETTCGIQAGDQLSLQDLLRGLMMVSGNDAAVAIAEHIAGSTEAFAQMMNDEAARLMATHTHFVNPHGLHDINHYTTAYDLYLIFNECIKYDAFIDVISTNTFTASITGADGLVRQELWEQTNFYAAGLAEQPRDAVIIGGKTGTTTPAGNCLILLETSAQGSPYISVIMGADTKSLLYQNMTALINGIPVNE